jgi:uncharacterized membrane protein YqjE
MSENASLPPPGGLFASLKGVVATVVEILQTRLALLLNEVAEEKQRLVRLLLLAFGAVFFFVLGVVLLVVLVTALFWESRVAVFAGFTLFFFGSAVLCVLGLKRAAKRRVALFSSSLHALGEDVAALRRQAGAAGRDK